MKLCDTTITVVNAKTDPQTRKDVYRATVIVGASWHGSIDTAIDDGLKAANKYIVRIPATADFGGKEYASPLDYANAEDVSKLFTLKNGDIIVRGALEGDNLKPADIHRNYEAFTVLGVTDNRRENTRARHWKVIGA